jgi:hypothetical protein
MAGPKIPAELSKVRKAAKDMKREVVHSRSKPKVYPQIRNLCPHEKVDCDKLVQWFSDMEDWGKRVRHDILRLEAACLLEGGDPGDPPPPPTKH